jgi:Leucine-rich repeat (LRR) protein
VGAEQYGIIGGSIIAILFALGFLFIWWEALRRTLWLSKAFEFPGHSVKEKTCLPLYGVLLLPDQLQALKNIFNVEREQIERILRRLEIKIERRKIMNLDLSDKGLSTLPESIENLKILKELHLSNNDLSTLPQSITRLTSLEVLHLSNNDMKTFPESLKKLK